MIEMSYWLHNDIHRHMTPKVKKQTNATFNLILHKTNVHNKFSLNEYFTFLRMNSSVIKFPLFFGVKMTREVQSNLFFFFLLLRVLTTLVSVTIWLLKKLFVSSSPQDSDTCDQHIQTVNAVRTMLSSITAAFELWKLRFCWVLRQMVKL